MNALCAVVLFVVAFAIGVDFVAPEIGAVRVASAADKAEAKGDPGADRGLKPGDQVVAIDGEPILAFEDIPTIVALAEKPVTIVVDRPSPSGPKRLTFVAKPHRDEDAPFPELGISAAAGLAPVPPGSAADLAGLLKHDQILGIAPVGSDAGVMTPEDIERFVQENPDRPAVLRVLRREYDPDGRPIRSEEITTEIMLGSKPVYELGLELLDEARVRSVLDRSPAHGALEVGDTIVSIAGRAATWSTSWESPTAIQPIPSTAVPCRSSYAAGKAHERSRGRSI
jgi:membrane-associated protease RseP (regulator of RpoE activity)